MGKAQLLKLRMSDPNYNIRQVLNMKILTGREAPRTPTMGYLPSTSAASTGLSLLGESLPGGPTAPPAGRAKLYQF